MSLWCECKNCGGNDELAMCENALLQAHISVAKAKQSYSGLLFGENYFLCVAIVCAISIVMLAGTMQPSPPAAYPQPSRAVMSDQF